MSEQPILKLETDERGVATLTMNRPDVHNAFDDVLIRQMTKALQKLDADTNVRVVVLAAEGKSFSAGADLNWMKRMAGYSWDENYQDSLTLAALMQTLAEMRKPTIAKVQGAAFGGGVGLVACCNIVIASDKASFCLSEVKLGLIPAVISPYVVAAIGARQARRYFISAERFRADTAQQIGLVHEVVELEQLEQRVNEMVDTLLQNGPQSIDAAKKLIDRVVELPLGEELIRETAQKIADQRASKEGREGVTAFLEKRKPSWIKE